MVPHIMPTFALRFCLLALLLGGGLGAYAATTPEVVYPPDAGSSM